MIDASSKPRRPQQLGQTIVMIGWGLLTSYTVAYVAARATLLLKRQRITLIDTSGGGFVTRPQQTLILSGVGEGGPPFTTFNRRIGDGAEWIFAPLSRLELACW